ncbi:MULTISPECIES: lipopolysaccharide biosynthesis protein [Serratia]|nr:lipopolysaccharide biosynthesis protein [Serratia marcescens]MBH3234828.1 lipopolysaccharide biosynthesis protein [Serratia marcescens]WPJ25381.1 lipopolysaccharide biosynthesis protein [Serratia marcescens]
MNDDVKKSTITGLLWSAAERFSVQGFQFVISIILARIISPAEFGLVGIILVFVFISDIIINSGFSQALIQKKDRDNIDLSTVFYFNVIIGIVLYGALFLLSPAIASYYERPELEHVLKMISIVIMIKPLYLVHMTLLSIRLDFKLRTKINFISAFLSGGIAVFLANKGFGVYALVWQQIANNFLIVLLSFFLIRWIPGLVFSFSSLARLFGFGSKLLIAGLVRSVVDNGYAILIGKYLSIKDVGLYTQGRNIPDLISMNLFTILQNVFFPVMSNLQNDRESLLKFYHRGVEGVAFLIVPVMIGLMMISEPFVRYFLSEQWMGAVVVMQWVALSRLIIPISALNCSLINSIGRSDAYLKVDLSKLPITIAALLVTVPFGLKVVVIGNALVSFICFFINAYYPGKWFGYGAIKQIKTMFPILISALIMAVSIYFIHFDNGLLEIFVKTTVGAIVYYVSALVMKVKTCQEINHVFLKTVFKR